MFQFFLKIILCCKLYHEFDRTIEKKMYFIGFIELPIRNLAPKTTTNLCKLQNTIKHFAIPVAITYEIKLPRVSVYS